MIEPRQPPPIVQRRGSGGLMTVLCGWNPSRKCDADLARLAMVETWKWCSPERELQPWLEAGRLHSHPFLEILTTGGRSRP